MAQGTYGGGTFGFPWGGGVGLYVDNSGRIYPQLCGGTPRWSVSAGYTPDLEGLLTGTSISGSAGSRSVRPNIGTSGSTTGVGFGTPGIGVTYGFGPLEMSRDFSRPWAVPYVRDSAAVAGVPGRNTVFEYGFPEPASSVQSLPSDVFVKGALPIQFPPAASQRAPRALPDILAEVGAFDQLDMNMPPSGGLPGLIQQYLRDR